MRYTTIIDISQMPAVYRNKAAVSIYLHIVLRCGYHDNDRDLLLCSLRQLAAELGLSLSAVRYALEVLQQAGLIDRQGNLLHVTKWCMEAPVSKRPASTKKSARALAKEQEREAQQRREQEREEDKKREKELNAAGKSSFILYYEGLQKAAAAGDESAARSMERHRAAYEVALKKMQL